ncbi:Putative GTP diphosphokinase RSH1, chloroplastic [Linum perenne]
MSSREFVDTITKDLLGSRIFVFTPRGEVTEYVVSLAKIFSFSVRLKLNSFGVD